MPSLINLNENPVYEFRICELSGFIRPRGHYHGLMLFARGRPITRPGACTLNLEHYCARGDGSGRFVPRNECRTQYTVGKDRLSIQFQETAQWKVRSELTYQFRADDCIDITFDFAFSRSYERFEAFIASYFYERRIPFLHIGETWVRPQSEPGAQLFFARDDNASTDVVDGRWDWLRDNKLFAADDGRKYTSPLAVAWNPDTHWALIQMIESAKCPSISVNTFAYAQDFSLIGADVHAGRRISARARILYRKVENLDAVVEWYKDWNTEFL